MCALSEAETHCDGDICRLLINKANANVAVLDKIKFPRDVRIWKTPRSPTPEMLPLAPRWKNINARKNTEVLSPLVISGCQVSDVSSVSDVGSTRSLHESPLLQGFSNTERQVILYENLVSRYNKKDIS